MQLFMFTKNVTPAKVKLIKDQLTELLTGYGEVDILITDGWDAPWSRITYEEVPFQEIYDHGDRKAQQLPAQRPSSIVNSK